MANHFEGDDAGRNELLRKMFAAHEKAGDAMTPNMTLVEELKNQLKVGKQNDHPAGMYGQTDEGSRGIGIAADSQNEKVRIDFGTPVAWLAMDPQQAIHLAQGLIKAAREANKSKSLTVEFPY